MARITIPMTLFILLFQGRVGSSYLIEALDAHPQVRAEGEKLVLIKQKGPGAQMEWARSFFSLSRSTAGHMSAIGFKVKLRDILPLEDFAAFINELQIKTIYMHRRNRIKAVVSEINSRHLAEATGEYNLYSIANRLSPITVDLHMFDKMLKIREKRDRELADYVGELHAPVLELQYESLLRDELKLLKDTYEFIETAFIPTRGRCVKHTPDNLRDAIANFHEVLDFYRGTIYEPMFDEVLGKKVAL